MKKIISILLVLMLAFSFAGCRSNKSSSSIPEDSITTESDSAAQKTVCKVYGISGPTGIGLANLMKKSDDKATKLDYKFSIVGSNEEIIAKITNGEADIAAVATNLASTLFNKTNGKISVLAVNTLGVLSVVAKGEEIDKIADLKGKTVFTTGQGANPEYISKFILEKNGLKVGKDVKLEFVTQPTELVTKVMQNEKAIVIAPQPVATTITVKDSAAKIVIDMNAEWNKVSKNKLVMGCIIARNEFIKNNPEAVAMFLKEYEESIKAVTEDIDTTATLCADYGLIPSSPIAKKAIPYCNIVFQSGEIMRTNLSAYLKFLFDSSPDSIGGAIPTDEFYYAKR